MIRFYMNLRLGSPFFPKKRHDRRLFLNSVRINGVEAQVSGIYVKSYGKGWGHLLLI